jgi:predicted N-formylglutamate amidohydrolase
VGVLWDQDERLSRPLIERLRAEPNLCVGDNEPYTGQLQGDCMWRHGTRRGLAHALIEIRNDLIQTLDDQVAWAERLAPIFREVLEGQRKGAR